MPDTHTPNDYQYHEPAVGGKDIVQTNGSLKYMLFSVQATNDAHISLDSITQDHGHQFYEIVLSGWGNTYSVIRKSSQGHNQVGQATHGLLSGSEQRNFWVSADENSGRVAAGQGSDITSQVIMEWDDGDPLHIDYAEVMTGWGSTGSWRFPAAEKYVSDLADCPPQPEIKYHTGNDYTYHVPPDSSRLVQQDGDVQYVTFAVKANNDAHIALDSTTHDHGHEFYEIVYSGWGNTQSVIRKSSQGNNQVVAQTHNMLSPNEYTYLWASVNQSSGIVAAGKGSDISQGMIMEWTDNAVLHVDYVEVMTGWGATGSWKFITG